MDTPSFFEAPATCLDLVAKNLTYCICEDNPLTGIVAKDRTRCKDEGQVPLKKSAYTCDNQNIRRKRAISENDNINDDDTIVDADLFSEIVPEEGITLGAMNWDIPADRKLTEAIAVQSCTDALQNSPVYANCLGHIDMDTHLEECITDLYVRIFTFRSIYIDTYSSYL